MMSIMEKQTKFVIVDLLQLIISIIFVLKSLYTYNLLLKETHWSTYFGVHVFTNQSSEQVVWNI